MKKDYKFTNKRYRFMKRIFDIIFAISLLFFSLPLMLFISLVIKIDSPGPILYKQVRLGQRGKKFSYLKYRTMGIHSEQQGTGPVFNLRNDSRISKVGIFLRSTALDELPVLLNVLRGDMSIVGPRAALPLEAARYSATQQLRLELKPGVTGYWQVFGRGTNSTDLDQMVQMDLEYAEKQSLFLDLKILLRTILIGFSNKAAY